jgi:MYXO-CTERM domain-containing protein
VGGPINNIYSLTPAENYACALVVPGSCATVTIPPPYTASLLFNLPSDGSAVQYQFEWVGEATYDPVPLPTGLGGLGLLGWRRKRKAQVQRSV